MRLSTQNAAALYALVNQEGVFNTRVRLIGEIPNTEPPDDAMARRDNENSYTRIYSEDDVPAQRGRPRGWYDDGRSYYYRPATLLPTTPLLRQSRLFPVWSVTVEDQR